MKEEELFAPVKKIFTDLGYKVNAEVKNCDLTAIKDDDFIIVELKTSLNVKLLSQGVNRQKAGANVFIAVPKPKNYHPRKWKDILYMLKKLELGLIFVTISEQFTFAEIVSEPKPFQKTRIYKPKQTAILNEINARHCDPNTGGVTKKKIVTAYVEQSIYIGCLLEIYGELSPKKLRTLGTDDKKTQRILASNFFGWFDKVCKGVYRLNDEWISAEKLYPEVVTYYRTLIQ